MKTLKLILTILSPLLFILLVVGEILLARSLSLSDGEQSSYVIACMFMDLVMVVIVFFIIDKKLRV